MPEPDPIHDDPKILADPQNPFADDACINDEGKRQPIAELLYNYILSTSYPSVIAIDAPWGAGKTWFLERFRCHCHNKGGINCVNYSAWENDFAEEPFAPLFSEISNNIAGQEDQKQKLFKESSVILKSLATGFVKSGTLGIFDPKQADKDVAESKELSQRLAEEHTEYKQSVANFKIALSGYVADSNQKLVILVDELDRCHPRFAIETLERIKHFFGVDGVHFVLGVASKALMELINGRYGPNVDATEYLERFITHWIELPSVAQNIFAIRYCHTHDISPNLSVILSKVAMPLKLKPREMQRLVHASSMIQKANNIDDVGVLEIIIILVYIRQKKRSLFDRLHLEGSSVVELLLFLRHSGYSMRKLDDGLAWMLISCCSTNFSYSIEEFKSFKNTEYHLSVDEFTEDKISPWLTYARNSGFMRQKMFQRLIKQIRFITV